MVPCGSLWDIPPSPPRFRVEAGQSFIALILVHFMLPAKIQDEETRMRVFQKRKLDLVKRAMELVHMCDCEIQMFIYSKSLKIGDEPRGSLTQYSSSDVDLLLANFLDEEQVEIFTDQEYKKLNVSLSPESVHLKYLRNLKVLQEHEAESKQTSELVKQDTIFPDVQAEAERVPSTDNQGATNAARKPIMLVAGGGCISGAKAPPRCFANVSIAEKNSDLDNEHEGQALGDSESWMLMEEEA
eukprot:768777-Hanusia_phi.AAC.1